jgi:hypothetical protein
MKTYTLILKDGEREVASWQVDREGHVVAFVNALEKKCANPACPWLTDDYRLEDMIIRQSQYFCCEDCMEAVL